MNNGNIIKENDEQLIRSDLIGYFNSVKVVIATTVFTLDAK